MPKGHEITPWTSCFLDAIRGLGALAVCMAHAFDFSGFFSRLDQPNPPPHLGRLAVVGFLVLSGYLITRQANLKTEFGFKGYFIDRLSRIYSVLIPALVFLGFVHLFPHADFAEDFQLNNPTWSQFFGHVFLLNAFPHESVSAFTASVPLWTLAIEWWLFMLFGLVFFKPRSWFWLLFPIALVSSVYHLWGGPEHGVARAWLLGVAVYYLPEIRAKTSFGLAVLAIGICIWKLTIGDQDGDYKAFHPLVLLSVATAFYAIKTLLQGIQKAPPNWLHWSMRYLARVSFSLYVTHFGMLLLWYPLSYQLSPGLHWATSVILTVIFAFLFAQVTEKQDHKLRKWLKKKWF